MQKREKRKNDVLANIIRIYVNSATPVSSKAIALEMDDRVSSATVRNIMAELEDEGFIGQPHTSAGRCPTDKGYRKYVSLLTDKLIAEKQKALEIEKEYSERIGSIEEIIRATSNILSTKLHHAGMIMWPTVDNLFFKHIEFVNVRAKTVLAILVTMTNAVRKYIIRIENDLQDKQLRKISNFLNQHYEEKNFSDISTYLREMLKKEDDYKNDISDITRLALDMIDKIMETDVENDIMLDGLEWFVDEPEFKDLRITQKIFRILSDRTTLSRKMRGEMPHKGLKIYIGKENVEDVFDGCSIITSGYVLHGRTIGRLGIIGPTRMRYGEVIRTVTSLSDFISRKLDEIR